MSKLARNRQIEFWNEAHVIPLDDSVAQMHGAPRMRGDVGFVRDENDGVAVLI